MAKTKVLPKCSVCGSHDALFVTLGNGERLPSYVIKVATGKMVCYSCNDMQKQNATCIECGKQFINRENGIDSKVCHVCA